MDNSGQSVGRQLRALRQARGMTLEQLSSLAGISASHLSRLERGQTQPSFKVAADLAQHLGVTLSDLLNDPHK